MQVAVKEREQRELGDLVATDGDRGHDAARVPVPLAGAERERESLESHPESLDRPRPALDDRNGLVPTEGALCTQFLQLLIDQLDRSEIAEQNRQRGSGKTAEEGGRMNCEG